jgi:hypothetical protein
LHDGLAGSRSRRDRYAGPLRSERPQAAAFAQLVRGSFANRTVVLITRGLVVRTTRRHQTSTFQSDHRRVPVVGWPALMPVSRWPAVEHVAQEIEGAAQSCCLSQGSDLDAAGRVAQHFAMPVDAVVRIDLIDHIQHEKVSELTALKAICSHLGSATTSEAAVLPPLAGVRARHPAAARAAHKRRDVPAAIASHR